MCPGSELRRGSSSSYSDHSPKASPKGSSRSSSRSSSGASSHGSSNDDLQDLKETERELLDEMIVRDVTEETSTDPVQQFGETKAVEPISEEEVEDDAPLDQCKDLISEKVNTTTTTTTTHTSSKSSLDPLSSFLSSNEMPSKEEEETSPTSGGLAAPDSKDSLEVQLYSVCDDISENLSGKEESVEDIKARVDRQISSQSEGEDHMEVIGETKDDDEPSRLEVTAEKVVLVSGQSSSREDSFEMFESSEVEAAKKVVTSTGFGLEEVKIQPDTMLENILEKFEKIETEDTVKVTATMTISTTVETIEASDSRRSNKNSSSEEPDHLNVQEAIESTDSIQQSTNKILEKKEEAVVEPPTEKSEEGQALSGDLSEDVDVLARQLATKTITTVTASSRRSSSGSSSSEEGVAVKLTGQESTESYDHPPSRMINQESTESSEAVILKKHESEDDGGIDFELTKSIEAEVVPATSGIPSIVTTKVQRSDSSSSSTSEEAVKLTAQSSVESTQPTKITAQASTDSSDAVKLVSQDSTDSSEAVRLETVSVLVKQSSAESTDKFEAVSEAVSSDSSMSTKQESTVKKNLDDSPMTAQDKTLADDNDDSSGSSDTEEEDDDRKAGAGAASSSDYDTSSAKPARNRRPDSFVSDTSSDYDSSAPGSRRPQSFVLEDEYDVITEEETAEVKEDAVKATIAAPNKVVHQSSTDDHSSSSSSSEDENDRKEEVKPTSEAGKTQRQTDGISTTTAPPPSSLLSSSSVPLPSLPSSLSAPHPPPPSSSDLHADSSVSLDVAESSVIHSNTLEEIDDIVGSGQPSPLTRSSDSNSENKSSQGRLINADTCRQISVDG